MVPELSGGVSDTVSGDSSRGVRKHRVLPEIPGQAMTPNGMISLLGAHKSIGHQPRPPSLAQLITDPENETEPVGRHPGEHPGEVFK